MTHSKSAHPSRDVAPHDEDILPATERDPAQALVDACPSDATTQVRIAEERARFVSSSAPTTGRDFLSAMVDLAILGTISVLAWRAIVPGAFAGFTIGVLVGTRAAMTRARSAVASSAAGALLLGLWHLITFRTLVRV